MYKEIEMKKLIQIIFWAFSLMTILSQEVSGQVYVEKQTRHRFAQMNFGVDFFRSIGGSSSFLNTEGVLEEFQLEAYSTPRLIIGGTHFWGHADFTISFPLSSKTYVKNGQEISFSSGLDTSFKVYPWKIKHGRIAPFGGIALSGFSFRQNNTTAEELNGASINKTVFPIMGGLTYNYKSHLLEIGVSKYFKNNLEYYVSDSQTTEVSVPSTFVNVSYRYMLDTSLGAERGWESGETETLTEKLNEQGHLNGFFLSAGPSSSFPLSIGKYNSDERPYLGKPAVGVFFEYALGYYLHNPDLNFSVTLRNYKASEDAFSVVQETGRRSIGFEVTKMLGDYHGFVPFIGPTVSMEKLNFSEIENDELIHDLQENKLGYGVTFGWDIRPNRIGGWLLRTNLRWTPSLSLDVVDGKDVSFGALEFNFIQLVIYPNRFKLWR